MSLAKDGEIMPSNTSANAIHKAQAAFAGVAEELGVSNEDDVQALVDEVRRPVAQFFDLEGIN